MKERVILHYDMDAFYASVEIKDNPSLRGKPIVVGESIVTTASYEARKFGVRSAMSVVESRKLCPRLIVVPVSKGKYGEVSAKVQDLVLRLTEKVEFIALDEGYLDITEIIKKYPSKEYFAQRFKEGIYKNTGLTCSVGVGYNKLSAKIASDARKPNGICIFSNNEEFIEYIAEKDINIIPGVGKKFRELLLEKDIIKVEDLYKYSLWELISFFGKSRGELIYSYSLGEDSREVEHKRKTHSIGNENTFRYPLESENEIERELESLFNKSYERLLKKELLSKSVTLKIRYEDRKTITRSKTLENPSDSKEVLKSFLTDLNEAVDYSIRVRLLGVSFGGLLKKSVRQLSFADREFLKKKTQLELLREKIKKIESSS